MRPEGSDLSDFSYAGLTRDDLNPAKRWLQRRRLDDALRAVPADLQPRLAIDYGGGDGELSARLADAYPQCQVLCFEPASLLRIEAARRLADVERAFLATSESALPSGRADLVLCTEVFEHLPEAETETAFTEIERVLRPGGVLVMGVPVEVGPPALAKGVFRGVRGQAGSVGDIWRAAWGGHIRRDAREIAPGRAYHFEHLGFDHRRLELRLRERFVVERRCGSPLRRAPVWMNSELYVVARRRTATP